MGRRERLDLAGRLAAELNHGEHQNFARLASEKPRMNGAGEPYTRSTVTALRRLGRVTIFWHGRRRVFFGTIDRRVRARQWRAGLAIDDFAVTSGLISRCADYACGRFFALTDKRKRYCSPTCADRHRQQVHRARRRAKSDPLAHARQLEDIARHEAMAGTRLAAEYAREKYDAIGQRMARGLQRDQQRRNPRHRRPGE